MCVFYRLLQPICINKIVVISPKLFYTIAILVVTEKIWI